MNKLALMIPDGVFNLVGLIQDKLGNDFDVYLTGGYLRDTFGGAPIKDIDIMIAPREGYVRTMDITVDVHRRVARAGIQKYFKGYRALFAEYVEGMAARGLAGLIMGYSEDLSIDTQLIVYGRPMTAEAIAHDMDLNICQIIMNTRGEVYATDEFLDGFRNGTIKILNGLSDKREEERIQRMLKKYPHFHVE